MVESAVSSTAADGMLHTAIPEKDRGTIVTSEALRLQGSPRTTCPGGAVGKGWVEAAYLATIWLCGQRLIPLFRR